MVVAMRLKGLISAVSLALTLTACAAPDPRQDFAAEVARAKAAHLPILISSDSFGYYWGSNVPRKRTVGFCNTSEVAIARIRIYADVCQVTHAGPPGPGGFTLEGPFPAGGYFFLESSPPAQVYDRYVMSSIEIEYVDGRTETHQDDIGSLLAPNLSNFCPQLTH